MEDYISEIRMFAFPEAVSGWILCDGRTLPVNGETSLLFKIIGTTFGGDGNNFKVPDLRDRVLIGRGPGYPDFTPGGENAHPLTIEEMPKHRHQVVASTNGSDSATPSGHYWPADGGYVNQANAAMSDQAVQEVGYGIGHNNMSPYLAVNYSICLRGIFPGGDSGIGEAFVGSLKIFAAKLESKEWLPCDGRLLPVADYGTLHSLINFTYGGNGTTTFALPDLRGRAPVSWGYPKDLSQYELGQMTGQATVTLTVPQMAKHYHPAQANAKGNTQRPDGKIWANEDRRPAINGFASEKGNGAMMNPAAIEESGGNQPHNNMMSYLPMQYLIAIKGIYPARP